MKEEYIINENIDRLDNSFFGTIGALNESTCDGNQMELMKHKNGEPYFL